MILIIAQGFHNLGSVYMDASLSQKGTMLKVKVVMCDLQWKSCLNWCVSILAHSPCVTTRQLLQEALVLPDLVQLAPPVPPFAPWLDMRKRLLA